MTPGAAPRGGIEVVRADITRLAVDAIVNAANTGLRGGGGVDGAIHRAAGPGLLDELRRRYPRGCAPGDAVLTGGHALPARYVVHAVGPNWRGGAEGEGAVLRRAYAEAFARAREAGDVRSLAFPSISTGVYGYPKRKAAAEALDVMREHAPAFDRVVACVFDPETEAVYRDVARERGVAVAGGPDDVGP
jgi:O-acetyl-ADP-ribose deacetylase (regulator of RNase III)